MDRKFTAAIVVIGGLMLAACGTLIGTGVGAGIGAIAGDTKTGALVGGGVGLLTDIF